MANSLVGGTGIKMPKQSIAGYDVQQLQNFTPQQMDLFQQLFSNVSPDSYTSKLAGGDQGQFAEMERPALQQFNELQGNLASRFSGMGTGGRHSSGFQNTMNQSQQDFAGQLQSRRQDLQRQALQDLMGMSGQLLGQKPYENILTEKKKSFWEKLLGGFSAAAPLIGGGAGLLMGGPTGASIGANAGSAFNNTWNS